MLGEFPLVETIELSHGLEYHYFPVIGYGSLKELYTMSKRNEYVVPRVLPSKIRHAISSVRNRTTPGPGQD
ncbi:hypothetical protein KIN20_026435 [Parelaphostrongylus tenuis]|uniref:Uncharacterized protein n=1 Tax=Parelaphostrongylus tenuis TaxID=148309 RepID=A0AAD5WD28_PARTN|nr:hypothetical protein KIN20_026435 [Parelaphostrongylus tenuis]